MNEYVRWEQPLYRLPRLTIWIMSAAVLCALFWAAHTNVRLYADMQGTLMPEQPPVQINAPRSGRVLTGPLQQWQTVKKGTPLVTLDALSGDASDAQLQLSIQQSTLRQAEQDILAAQTDLSAKKSVLEQARMLYEIGGLPRNDLDKAQQETAQASTALNRAQAARAAAQAQLTLLSRSQKVVITSPINGQITQLADLHDGQTVTAGTNLMSILPQGGHLVFRGFVAERDRPKLHSGATVQIAWNSYPRQKYGVTDAVVKAVAPTSTVNDKGLATYQLDVTLNEPSATWKLGDRALLPGMVGEAHILSKNRTILAVFFDWIRGIDPWN